MQYPVLIGDIGGTNARFGLVHDAFSPARHFPPVRLTDFPGLEEAIQSTVLDQVSDWPASMALAVATPLVGEKFRLTNADWAIDPEGLMTHFGLKTLELMNDFTAQGLAALSLSEEHLEAVGTGMIADEQPRVVIGPGTGLGVANLVPATGRWIVIPGEGGHIDLGARTAREQAIWEHLPRLSGRVSAEEAVSGRGLVALYGAICAADSLEPATDDSSRIAGLAEQGPDKAAREAVELFTRLLGRIAGDMALVTMARGGVYIAGGITKKLLPIVGSTIFRQEFDNKQPYAQIMRSIPVLLMQHQTPALEGLSAYIRQPARFIIAGAHRRYERKGV